jgi:hypothetical protein
MAPEGAVFFLTINLNLYNFFGMNMLSGFATMGFNSRISLYWSANFIYYLHELFFSETLKVKLLGIRMNSCGNLQ